MVRSLLIVAAVLLVACAPPARPRTVVRYAGSAVGAEGEVLTRQARRFELLHPDVRIEIVPTPDAADQRHQLYVHWLNAGSSTPDVLQLDVIWTPELASAGWLRPLEPFGLDEQAFFAQTVAADSWQGHVYAVPLFVDAGMLYWRTDLVDHAPRTFAELTAMAEAARAAHGVRHGLVWQAARYEGLVTVFLEVLTGMGGVILADDGRVAVDSAAGTRALAFMRDALGGLVPEAALGWQEEECRFAFQNGDAVFMRNWPYAYPLMQDASASRVAGRFAVAPMPAGEGGQPAATLGGQQLAINARSRVPAAAWLLIEFLTAPEQELERARVAGEYPPRPSLYQSGALDRVLPIPAADALRVIEHAVARPVTPVYSELSETLQIQLHRALSRQAEPAGALAAAATQMQAVLDEVRRPPRPASQAAQACFFALVGLAGAALAWVAWRRWRRGPPAGAAAGEERLAWLMVSPAALVVAAIAIFPLLWTIWESMHAHDLRMPARGRPFVGLRHYVELGANARFWAALAHTAIFTVVSVTLELLLGLALALLLHRVGRARGALRTITLLPWALPTVVAALLWRFMFSDGGVADAVLGHTGPGAHGVGWLVDATLAWVPLVLADVWKTTPFVALLLLAGLAQIDETLYDAARVDGASRWQQLTHITLPMLRPALLVVLVFRTLDAFRIFDLVYVITGGGPGTATEPLSLHAFTTLMADLRFGRGAALSVIVFAVAFALALLYARLLGAGAEERR